MASVVRPFPGPADDGDELTFCSTCAFGAVCLPSGYDKTALAALHCLIEHVGPFDAGHHIFRVDDEFAAIYAVRAGCVKTYVVDEEGREQVLGFYLPGELIGLDAIYPTRYPCNAVTLDAATLCRFSFPAMATLATKMPGLQQQLFRLLSKDLGSAAARAGDFGADERLAAFLLDLGERYAARGYSARVFRLAMSRTDVANHLGLAPETVSRVLRRFQDERMIGVDGRTIELADPARLAHVARCLRRRA